jgi:hypothetical protein
VKHVRREVRLPRFVPALVLRSCLLLALFTSLGCGGGDGGGDGDGGTGNPNLVGGDGAFSSTYYNRILDFTLTVPPGWTVASDGSFENETGLVEGQVGPLPNGPGDFAQDVEDFLDQIEAGSSSYEEVARDQVFLDGQNAERIVIDLRPGTTGTDTREVVIPIDKGDQDAVVVIKLPEWGWTPEVQDDIDLIVHDITRQDSVAGGLRRCLNQLEWAYETENTDAYLEHISDCAALEGAGMTRAGLLASAEFHAQVAEVWALNSWDMAITNIRNIVQTAPDRAECDHSGHSIITGDRAGDSVYPPLTNHVWFGLEDGLWRYRAESVNGTGDGGPCAD